MATATLWEGELDDDVYWKLVAIMEAVQNTPGNFDESEALVVAKVLQDFTVNDLEHIDTLNIEVDDE